jgi:pimeloyl-ACP methyl ester carboxylesterase
MHTYQSRPFRRWASADALRQAITESRPDVLVAHSLGSVLAYETLWAHPKLSVGLLVTLGSPLAMPGVVFDRLRPAPAGGLGARPPGVGRWLNFADVGDLVAVPRSLADRFAGVERDAEITMPDWRFHGVTRYLASPAIREVLLPHLDRE